MVTLAAPLGRPEPIATVSTIQHAERVSSAEPARHALYSVLEDVIGAENAETLMTHLPMDSVDELATKTDLGFVRRELGVEIQLVGDDLRAFKAEMREFKTEMREFKAEMREFRTEINSRFDRLQRQQYTISMGMVTALTAIFALISRL